MPTPYENHAAQNHPMKRTHATITVTPRETIALALRLDRFPNAGPNPSISGMKKLYWGADAYVIKCGQYAYHVDADTYRAARDGVTLTHHDDIPTYHLDHSL